MSAGRSATSRLFDMGHKVVVFGLVTFSAVTIFDVGRGMYNIIRINRKSLPPPVAAPDLLSVADDNNSNGNAKA